MRPLRPLLGILIALATILLGAVPLAGAQAAKPDHYVNPFTNPGWEPSRTDMGVDWVSVHPLPVVAIGDALILGSQDKSPWPGQHLIWYKLLDGSHAGDIIYVAEHLRGLAQVGRVVRAGQQIAVAVPGYPWTEWGWADSYGSPRAYPCYHEGEQTNSGKEMARFLESVGAQVGDPPGPGPDRPRGRLC